MFLFGVCVLFGNTEVFFVMPMSAIRLREEEMAGCLSVRGVEKGLV